MDRKTKTLMEQSTIEALIKRIESCFADVQLGKGVSWREADIIDDYGSMEARKLARAQDEKKDWTKIPYDLIGDRYYNAVLSFMDLEGLLFHLPAVMRFSLLHYKKSDSLITDSLTYTVCDPKKISVLKTSLTKDQKECLQDYLHFCLNHRDYFDDNGIQAALEAYQ